MTPIIFKPASELSFFTIEKEMQQLTALFSQDKEIVIDLSEVTRCDSAGLAFLIEAKRLEKHWHKTCLIQGISHSLLALATFCGVDGVLDIK